FRTGDVSLARSLSQETHRPNRARQSAALQKMNAWRMAAAILYQEPSVEGIQRLAAEMHRLAEEGGAGAKETALMWVRVGQVDERIVSNYASAKTAYTKALAFDAECQPASEGLARLEQRER